MIPMAFMRFAIKKGGTTQWKKLLLLKFISRCILLLYNSMLSYLINSEYRSELMLSKTEAFDTIDNSKYGYK